jgi:predicted ATPase
LEAVPMIRLIEALNYRCLRYVRRELRDFQVLVGPNASGKSTFLDVVAFLGDLVTHGLERAVGERSEEVLDLVSGRQGDGFELAIELGIPEAKRVARKTFSYDVIRYEVGIGVDREGHESSIVAEKLLLKKSSETEEKTVQRNLFPRAVTAPRTILTPKGAQGTKTVVNKISDGNDNFYGEPKGGWDYTFKFKLGPKICALSNLPDDPKKFPAGTWFKDLMKSHVRRLVLSSASMRKPSPPAKRKEFLPDGSSLPWIIRSLRKEHPDRFNDWVDHLKTALDDLETVTTTERPEDRHCFLSVRYKNGIEIPSWMVSDGTLRLMALTLLAYVPALGGVWLIEEPENGIHPRAVETVFNSLSSVYNAQILVATHSPLILGLGDISDVLCFAATRDGATDIVAGGEHPALRDWKGEENLGVLFAGGVLG